MITRRQFLGHSCSLGVAAATLSSSMLSLGLSRLAAAQTAPGYRALVCVLLAGGNDSFNMLVPTDADQYTEYQGIRPPVARGDDHFDPGSKYHIPNNVSYTRYFIAHILQFQFHKAACEMAGWEGPLHRCSVYGSKEVGERFNAMLEMGASQPWPEALEAFIGTREMDGTAMVEYFAPLMTWLQEQNADRSCGW